MAMTEELKFSDTAVVLTALAKKVCSSSFLESHTSNSSGNSKKQSSFHEQLRAEHESFKAVSDKDEENWWA